MVVFRGFRVLPQDEMELGAVVVDIRVIVILLQGLLEIVDRGILVSCIIC